MNQSFYFLPIGLKNVKLIQNILGYSYGGSKTEWKSVK